MASPNLSELVTTTLRSRTKKLADNVTNNNVSNNIYGLYLENTHVNVISDNDFFKNEYGIYLLDCTNNDISNNNVTGGDYGIYLLNSHR